MELMSKRAAGRWAMKLLPCAALLLLATLYFLNRSSAQRTSKISVPARVQTKQSAEEAAGTRTPTLQITSVVQHGNIFEIQGSTDPGAVVMINGQTAATFFEGNSFRHFVGPLPPGTSIITITAQDPQGGVNTQQMAFTTK